MIAFAWLTGGLAAWFVAGALIAIPIGRWLRRRQPPPDDCEETR